MLATSLLVVPKILGYTTNDAYWDPEISDKYKPITEQVKEHLDKVLPVAYPEFNLHEIEPMVRRVAEFHGLKDDPRSWDKAYQIMYSISSDFRPKMGLKIREKQYQSTIIVVEYRYETENA